MGFPSDFEQGISMAFFVSASAFPSSNASSKTVVFVARSRLDAPRSRQAFMGT
jgi:hypothetical protein